MELKSAAANAHSRQVRLHSRPQVLQRLRRLNAHTWSSSKIGLNRSTSSGLLSRLPAWMQLPRLAISVSQKDKGPKPDLKAGPRVWGPAPAWGKHKDGPDSEDDELKLKPGEEECSICFNAAAKIQLKPCRHKSCLGCVHRLRAANIFKPDAGIKCPFCRQFVGGYEALEGDAEAKQLLREANKSARAATAARDPVHQHSQQPSAVHAHAPDGLAQKPSLSPDVDWDCGHCRNVNRAFRVECNKCGRPKPEAKRSPVQVTNASGHPNIGGRTVDLLQANHVQILQFVTQKLHPGLNRAFQEAGTPYNDLGSQPQVSGDAESALKAFASNGQARLLRVIKTLVENEHVPGLVTHWFGNYGLQDLVDAAHILRLAAHRLRSQGKGTADNLAKLHGNYNGKDAFGAIHAEVAKSLTRDMIFNMQGSFVVQKIVTLSTHAELVALARTIMPLGSELMTDKTGPHLLMKVVDILSIISFGNSKLASEAGDLLDDFCGQYVRNSELLIRHAGHRMSGQVLVEAVQGALPRGNAITVAKILATEVIRLVERSGGGLTTLLDLISLQPSEEKAAEEMTTAICIVASHCEGKFAQIALKTSTDGHQLVRRCLERLSAAEERDWVDTILAELVSDAEALNADRKALDVLIFALSLATINHLTFTNHLQTLDILVDGPQADLIREEATALRAESGLVPGHEGAQVASAAKQSAAHRSPPPPPPPPLQQQQQQAAATPETAPSPPTPPPARDEGLILPGSSAFASVGTMMRKDESSDEEEPMPAAKTKKAGSGQVPGKLNGHMLGSSFKGPLPPPQTARQPSDAASDKSTGSKAVKGGKGAKRAQQAKATATTKQTSGVPPAEDAPAAGTGKSLQSKTSQDSTSAAAPTPAVAPTPPATPTPATTPHTEAVSSRGLPGQSHTGLATQGSGLQNGAGSGVTTPASSVPASPAGPAPLQVQPDSAGAAASTLTTPPGFQLNGQAPSAAQQGPPPSQPSSNPFLSSMFFPMPSTASASGAQHPTQQPPQQPQAATAAASTQPSAAPFPYGAAMFPPRGPAQNLPPSYNPYQPYQTQQGGPPRMPGLYNPSAAGPFGSRPPPQRVPYNPLGSMGPRFHSQPAGFSGQQAGFPGQPSGFPGASPFSGPPPFQAPSPFAQHLPHAAAPNGVFPPSMPNVFSQAPFYPQQQQHQQQQAGHAAGPHMNAFSGLPPHMQQAFGGQQSPSPSAQTPHIPARQAAGASINGPEPIKPNAAPNPTPVPAPNGLPPHLASMMQTRSSDGPAADGATASSGNLPSEVPSAASSRVPSPGPTQQPEVSTVQTRGRSPANRREAEPSPLASGNTTPATASSSPARQPAIPRQAKKTAAPASKPAPPPKPRPEPESSAFNDFAARIPGESAMMREARLAADRETAAEAARRKSEDEAWAMAGGKNKSGRGNGQAASHSPAAPHQQNNASSFEGWAQQPPPAPPPRARAPSASRAGVASVQQGAMSVKAWTCRICTYLHERPTETEFLTCKICGSEKA
ncbi:hypothetical protein WJX74_001088 [Apatococcus lobatus]|uniref:RING-type E3 ubiquitin transferase n=1 Tax=Apatococcus lobatus TaxID=904363 RepID=A0AAW1QLF0_9CHLO